MKLFRRASILLLSTILIGVIFFRLTPADFRGHRLYNASWAGSVFRVKLLLLLGADVNYYCSSGTPLHAAAANGNVNVMQILLGNGAMVDKEAKYGITPLFEARQYKHPEAEKLLLSRGANPDTSHISPP